MAIAKPSLLASAAFIALLSFPAHAENSIASFFKFNDSDDGSKSETIVEKAKPDAKAATKDAKDAAKDVKAPAAKTAAPAPATAPATEKLPAKPAETVMPAGKPTEAAAPAKTSDKPAETMPVEAAKTTAPAVAPAAEKTPGRHGPEKAEEPAKKEAAKPVETNAPKADDPELAKTAYGVAKSNGLKTFIELMDHAGLSARLKGTGMQTFFVPNDAAFEKLGAKKLEELKSKEGADKLNAILTYHIVNGKMVSQQFKGTVSEPNATQGAILKIDGTGKDVMVGTGKLVKGDITASNGIIHVIDAVQVPPGH